MKGDVVTPRPSAQARRVPDHFPSDHHRLIFILDTLETLSEVDWEKNRHLPFSYLDALKLLHNFSVQSV